MVTLGLERSDVGTSMYEGSADKSSDCKAVDGGGSKESFIGLCNRQKLKYLLLLLGPVPLSEIAAPRTAST